MVAIEMNKISATLCLLAADDYQNDVYNSYKSQN